MQVIQPKIGQAQERNFTGQVSLAKLIEGHNGEALKLYQVEFSAEARTDWHTHDGIQVLYVLSGTCRVQKDGEKVTDVPTGGIVIFESAEKHWHGADPEGTMVHLAYGLYAQTNWLEPVSDADYAG